METVQMEILLEPFVCFVYYRSGIHLIMNVISRGNVYQLDKKCEKVFFLLEERK